MNQLLLLAGMMMLASASSPNAHAFGHNLIAFWIQRGPEFGAFDFVTIMGVNPKYTQNQPLVVSNGPGTLHGTCSFMTGGNALSVDYSINSGGWISLCDAYGSATGTVPNLANGDNLQFRTNFGTTGISVIVTLRKTDASGPTLDTFGASN